jgi:hypothetical protein
MHVDRGDHPGEAPDIVLILGGGFAQALMLSQNPPVPRPSCRLLPWRILIGFLCKTRKKDR